MISSFQIHSKGLKFGIYGDIGTRTCKNYPGNQYYIPLDAETYASWGVDMLKLDCCFTGYNMVEGRRYHNSYIVIVLNFIPRANL
jgi:hypothetical protein